RSRLLPLPRRPAGQRGPGGGGRRAHPRGRRQPRAGLSGMEQGGMEQGGIGESDSLQRLWTPYRMAYIRRDSGAQAAGSEQCPFCVIPRGDDAEGLVVARGEECYAVLNLHPYNPGHLMVIPYRHVAELEDLTEAESHELMTMTQAALRTIKTVSQ